MAFKPNKHQKTHIEIKQRLRTALPHEVPSLIQLQGENTLSWQKACPNRFAWKAQLREAQFAMEKDSMDARDHEEVLIDIEALHQAGRGEQPDREIIRQKIRKAGK
jgi:hypothetical protein